MTDMKEIAEKMADAQAAYMAAQARGMGIAMVKERMKNIAFNYFDELRKAALENISLREEVDSLDAALADADEELRKVKEAKGPKGSKG